jgi:hypothetical protein
MAWAHCGLLQDKSPPAGRARLVYSVEDGHLPGTVVAMAKPEDGVVSQSAMARLSAAAETLSQAWRGKLK